MGWMKGGRIDALLMEVDNSESEREDYGRGSMGGSERSPLLENYLPSSPGEHTESTHVFTGLNALEIAIFADAKRSLSQPCAQGIIDSLWTGRIMFWTSLSVNTRKEPRRDHQSVSLTSSNLEPLILNLGRNTDPCCRLRVPKYQKAFEALFIFLAMYYAVLFEGNVQQVMPEEVLLYIWIVAFAYDEFGDYQDASLLYTANFWSLWDIGIVGVGLAFLITRESPRTGNQTQAMMV